MSNDRSKYLYPKTVKGNPYLYFRHPKLGKPIRLPLDQTSPEFNRCYDACIKALGDVDKPGRPTAPVEIADSDTKHVSFVGGTIGAAITKYKESTAFTELKQSTQRKYNKTIDVMRDHIGRLPFSDFDTDAVDIYSEKLAQKLGPSVARNHVWMISLLFQCCRKYPEFGLKGKVNPVVDAEQRYSVKRQNPAWSQDAQELFYTTAPQHLKDAFTLLRYGAQRGGDCTKMMLSDYDGETLMVIPEKQGTERGEPNLIPCVKPLRDFLDGLIEQRGGKTGPILLNAKGKPWASAENLSERIRDHLIDIGLAKVGTKTISMHGLRGNAASEVAELMMGTGAIKIVGGWRSDALPEYYAKAAEKRAMGKVVRERWDEHIEKKAADRVAKKRANIRSVK